MYSTYAAASNMAGRIVRSKRGKNNLISNDNFVYTRANVQGQYTNWKCIELRRENCSAHAKTRNDEALILSSRQHTHLSRSHAKKNMNARRHQLDANTGNSRQINSTWIIVKAFINM